MVDISIVDSNRISEFFERLNKNGDFVRYFIRLLFLVINLSTSFAANSAIVNTLGLGGAKDVWDSNEKKSLTYCIDSLGMSFDEYFYMEAAMSSATQEWELFTDVDFIHKTTYDTQCNNTNLNVLFNVRKNNNWNQEARAFFPGDSRLLR